MGAMAAMVVPDLFRMGQCELALQLDVIGRSPDQNSKFTRLGGPISFLNVIEGERPAIEFEGYALALARLQVHLSKPLQFLHWTRNAGVRISDIQLRYLRPLTMTRVAHIEGNHDGVVQGSTVRRYR